jgi:hypothetical protein
MSILRTIGAVVFAIGAVLSNAPMDRLSCATTRRFSNETIWSLAVGIAVGGGLLAAFGVRQ